MSTAKWIRFAVLLSFAGLFGWLCYARGEWLWAGASIVFLLFALAIFRR